MRNVLCPRGKRLDPFVSLLRGLAYRDVLCVKCRQATENTGQNNSTNQYLAPPICCEFHEKETTPLRTVYRLSDAARFSFRFRLRDDEAAGVPGAADGRRAVDK